MKIVEVEWHDSMVLNDGGWLDAEDADESLTLESLSHRSAGYLLRSEPQAVAIACSIYEGNDGPRAAGVIVIPRRAIIRIQEIDAGIELGEAA